MSLDGFAGVLMEAGWPPDAGLPDLALDRPAPPECTSINSLMVSGRWPLGYLQAQLEVLGGAEPRTLGSDP